MGVLGKANIGGVLRNLTGEGYVNISGVLRPITIGNFNIGGVLLAGGYTWKRYTAVPFYTCTEKTTPGLEYSNYINTIVTKCSGKQIDTSTGKYIFTGVAEIQLSSIKTGDYYIPDKSDETKVGLITNRFSAGAGCEITYTLYELSATLTSYEKGTYIEDVTSPSENAYPDNGRHTDGYWYVKQ